MHSTWLVMWLINASSLIVDVFVFILILCDLTCDLTCDPVSLVPEEDEHLEDV